MPNTEACFLIMIFMGFPYATALSIYVLPFAFIETIMYYIPQGPSSTGLQKPYPTSSRLWYNLICSTQKNIGLVQRVQNYAAMLIIGNIDYINCRAMYLVKSLNLHTNRDMRDYFLYTPGWLVAHEFLNLWTFKFSTLHENHIFQRMSKIFCVEFQRYTLKFHTQYLTHTLKDAWFIKKLKFKSS